MLQSSVSFSSERNVIENNSSPVTVPRSNSRLIGDIKSVDETSAALEVPVKNADGNHAKPETNRNITAYILGSNDWGSSSKLRSEREGIKASETHHHGDGKSYFPDDKIARNIKNLFKQGKVDEAERLVNEKPARCVWVLTALMQGYISVGDRKNAERIFKSMVDQKLNIDTWAYSSIIRYYRDIGDKEQALNVMMIMLKTKIEPDDKLDKSIINPLLKVYGCTYDQSSYIEYQLEKPKLELAVDIMSMLMNRCGQKRDLEGAEHIFSRMKELDDQPGSRSTISLLKAYAYVGDITGMYATMEKHQLPFDIFNGEMLMKACYNAQDYEKAESVLAETEKRGIKPNTEIYRVLIETYINAGMEEEAKDAMSRAECHGCTFDEHSYSRLMKRCVATKHHKMLPWLQSKMPGEVMESLLNASDPHFHVRHALNYLAEINPGIFTVVKGKHKGAPV